MTTKQGILTLTPIALRRTWPSQTVYQYTHIARRSKLVQTASQPKGVAVSSQDSHVFIAEASHIEVLKFGQKVTHLDVSYTPLCVDVKGDVVVVGGEVCGYHHHSAGCTGLMNRLG